MLSEGTVVDAIVTESTTGLCDESLVPSCSWYCRYRPAGLVIDEPLVVIGADQPLQITPSVDVRVLSWRDVPAGFEATQLAVVQVKELAPPSSVQLWKVPAPA